MFALLPDGADRDALLAPCHHPAGREVERAEGRGGVHVQGRNQHLPGAARVPAAGGGVAEDPRPGRRRRRGGRGRSHLSVGEPQRALSILGRRRPQEAPQAVGRASQSQQK